jgi:hypothetical protein
MFAVILIGVLWARIAITIEQYSEKQSELSNLGTVILEGHMKLDDRNASSAEHVAFDHRVETAVQSVRHEADERLWWNIGFTLGLLTSLNYLLQLLNRSMIYVAYGD